VALAAAVAVAVSGLGACGDDGGGSAQAFCASVADRDAFAAVVDGFDYSDRDRALDQMRTARVELGELREDAPGEIRSDLDVQVDATETLIDALEAAPAGDPVATVEAVRAVQPDLDEVEEAGARLEAWTREHCPATT
jgi:hypothetical protein